MITLSIFWALVLALFLIRDEKPTQSQLSRNVHPQTGEIKT
jgi:hypothetical protein